MHDLNDKVIVFVVAALLSNGTETVILSRPEHQRVKMYMIENKLFLTVQGISINRTFG